MIQNKRILITGSNGFIGSHLVAKLLVQNKLDLIVRESSNLWRIAQYRNHPNFSLHICDLMQKKKVKEVVTQVNPDYIFHCATEGASHWQNNAESILQSNVLGTLHLLDACKHISFEAFLNVGSSSEYGFSTRPMSETDCIHPNSYYAVAKASQTLLCEYVAKNENKKIITTRLFSVFGPYEDSHKFFPQILNALSTGESFKLADPNNAHDFIYIDAVISYLVAIAASSTATEPIYNIGSGIQSSLLQVVTTLEKISNKQLNAHWGSYPNHRWDTNSWVSNMSRTYQTIKPATSISLERALSKYWKWYLKNKFVYEIQ